MSRLRLLAFAFCLAPAAAQAQAPGQAAIEAALNPEDGNWLFYVTVNLATGETKFTDSYDEFLSFKSELD